MEDKKDEKKEEYYAAVIWKDLDGKHHIIGTLAYFDGKYYFKYEQTRLNEAREKNFIDVASFNDDDKLYISEHSLFSFFKMRVSEKFKEVPGALGELIETGGRSATDDISIMAIPEAYREAIKAEIQGIEKRQEEEENKKKEANSREDD